MKQPTKLTTDHIDGILIGSGFRPGVPGFFFAPRQWTRQQCDAIAFQIKTPYGFELREIPRSTAMQCLTIFIEKYETQ